MNPAMSRSVSWWSVCEYAAPLLDSVDSWPVAGTAEWQELADDDPRKLASLLDAARIWALGAENDQQARCEASKAISSAANWSSLAREIAQRRALFDERPWLERRPA